MCNALSESRELYDHLFGDLLMSNQWNVLNVSKAITRSS
ncbi:hypothetical protein BFRIPA_00165 (plasmid) [Peribacillus frigoritolerans]